MVIPVSSITAAFHWLFKLLLSFLVRIHRHSMRIFAYITNENIFVLFSFFFNVKYSIFSFYLGNIISYKPNVTSSNRISDWLERLLLAERSVRTIGCRLHTLEILRKVAKPSGVCEFMHLSKCAYRMFFFMLWQHLLVVPPSVWYHVYSWKDLQQKCGKLTKIVSCSKHCAVHPW